MALISRYGTIFGDVPQTMGRIFFVAPSAGSTYVNGATVIASDNNDGLSPERPLLTWQRAHDLCTANAGDVVVGLAGTHTLTSTLVITTAGITFWGVASDEMAFNRHATANSSNARTILDMTGTSDELISIQASGTELGYLVLRPTSGFSCISRQTTSGLDGLYLHDLVIDMNIGAPSIETRGIDFGNVRGGTGTARLPLGSQAPIGGATVYVDNVTVLNRGANGESFHAATGFYTVTNCRFDNRAGTQASSFIVATGSIGYLNNCVWTNEGTTTVQLSGFAGNATANSWTAVNCRFGTTSGDIVGLTSVLNAVTCYEPASGGTLSVAN